MLQEHALCMMPSLLRQLQEWTTLQRLLAARILHILFLLAGGSLADQVPNVLAALRQGAGQMPVDLSYLSPVKPSYVPCLKEDSVGQGSLPMCLIVSSPQ